MHGEVIWLIEEPLLTKVEVGDSLTAGNTTGYFSRRRTDDRNLVWDRAALWRNGGAPPIAQIDLADVEISAIWAASPQRIAEDLPILSPPQMPA